MGVATVLLWTDLRLRWEQKGRNAAPFYVRRGDSGQKPCGRRW